MSVATIERTPVSVPADETAAVRVVALERRTIDSALIGFGVVATAVFAIAGGLLTWLQLLERLRHQRTVVPEHHLPVRRGAHRRRPD